ncbi:hypothetical protein [Promicromonospora aerolata]|uniref:Centromere-binding protein ParB C-terminal domain-containing protein n=1 Tax=Promicromonospora aerolata TaxID=195749 RepID=A0ABW4UZW1_9MICO
MTARNTRTVRQKPRVPTKEELAQYEAMRATAKAAMRRAESIRAALLDLFDVAEHNVNRGRGDGALRAAVIAVKEARRS